MLARSIISLGAAVLLWPAVAGPGGQAHGQDTRPGIAVFPFDNGGSYGQEKDNFDALQKGIAGLMISDLAANAAVRVVERDQLQKLLDEQNLGAAGAGGPGRVDPQTAAKIGKLVGARYVVTGVFVDFYGDFRLDARLINVETSEIIKVESDRMQRDHLFDLIRAVASKLMRDANLPALPKRASQQPMNRQVPTEALTYYSRALLYHDRGQKALAVAMYEKALQIFPDFAEASDGLKREKTS